MGTRPYDESETSTARDALSSLSAGRMALHRAMECLTNDDGTPIKRAPVVARQRAQRNALDALDSITRFLRANGSAISTAQYARRPGAPSR